MQTSERFSLTVLGSGTCTPSTRRQPAGYLLRSGSRRYLMDSGSGTIGRLAALGTSVRDLDGLFYTHIHADHTGDLIPMLFSIRNAYGPSRTQDLTIFGSPDFGAFFEQLAQIYGKWIYSREYSIRVDTLNPDAQRRTIPDDLQVEAVPMEHTPGSLGYRFQDTKGRVIAFTGDADESPNLLRLLRDADLVVADCSMPDGQKLSGHLTPSPLARACESARCRKLILSHLYPPADEADLESVVRRYFSGEVARAEDGITYSL